MSTPDNEDQILNTCATYRFTKPQTASIANEIVIGKDCTHNPLGQVNPSFSPPILIQSCHRVPTDNLTVCATPPALVDRQFERGKKLCSHDLLAR
jgi:hypothetical protein